MADPVEVFRPQPNPQQDDRFINPDKLNMYRSPSPCYTCHGGNREKDNFKLDLRGFNSDPFKGFDRLKGKDDDAKLLLALMEQNRGGKGAQERFEKGDPIEKTLTVLGRMPDKFSLQFTDKKLSLKTNFAQAVEAVPTVKLDDNSRKILGSVKELTLEGKSFSLDLSDKQSIPINQEIPLLGKATDLSIGDGNKQVKFDAEFDKDSQRVALKNIQGIAIKMDGGKSLAIHELSLDTSGPTPMIKVNIDNPKERPSYVSEKLWPKTITAPIPLDKVVPGMNADFIKGLVKTLSDAKTALDNKDASMFLSGIPDQGLREKLQGMLKGLTSVTKDGDKYEIVRNNGEVKQGFGGPEASVGSRVSFRVGKDPERPSITDIQGINFSAPLPAELKLGDKFSIGLKGVELGPKAQDGSRTLTVKTDNVLDNVTIRLGADMKPITDADGNWSASVVVKNPLATDPNNARLGFDLRFDKNGQPNMKASEILDLTSRASRQGVDLSLAGGGMAVFSAASGAAADAAKVVEWIKGWFD